MKNKHKIAVIGLKGLPAFGGAAAVGENIIEQLTDKYDFTVYSTSSHTDLKTCEYNGYKQIVFNKLPFKRLNTLYYYIISALHTILFGSYDLVHLHHRDAAFILLILRIRYKTIITTHGSFQITDKWKKYKWFFQANETFFVKYADIRTCVSLQEKRLYEKKLGLSFHYIPNGIDINEFDHQFDFTKRSPYLFFGAGRIIKTKGLEVLLKSLKNTDCKIPLFVAGDLNQTRDYKEEILQLSEGLDVKFLGLIKDKTLLMDYIRKAKLFICPSSIEAMSMMLIEAVSVKVPVIASDITPNRDIFSDQEILFFKTDSYIDLSKKILFALNHESIMMLKAKSAYNRCLKEYNMKSISKRYSVLYDSITQF